jgi:hypothetical protein
VIGRLVYLAPFVTADETWRWCFDAPARPLKTRPHRPTNDLRARALDRRMVRRHAVDPAKEDSRGKFGNIDAFARRDAAGATGCCTRWREWGVERGETG